MGFSRNILPGIGRNGDLPSGGWKIRFGKHPDLTDKSGTISWDNTKVVPLIWSGNWGISGSWRENSPTTTSRRAFGKTIGYVAITPMTSYSVGQYNIYSSNASWNMIEIYGGIETVMAMNSITSDIKLTCTVWLEKKFGGGGSLYYKLFKNPFVKGFSACCKSGKRWNLMGFCRNILPGNAGGNPFPGYKLKTGTLFSGGFQTFTWDKSKIIPLIIHINCSGGGNYYTARRAYFNLNNISKTILYLEDIDPGSCRGSTESDICTLSFATLEQLQNIDSCSFTQSGGGNGFSLTAQCTMWLEKVGA